MWNRGKQNAFIFVDDIFLHLSGPIEQVYTHYKMSYVFNVGLITPLDTNLPSVFPHFKLSLIVMNMQMR